MHDDTSGKEFDKRVGTLVTLSTEWFREHQDTEMTLGFSMYVDESRSERLQHPYSLLLDGSMECLMGVLPLLAARLTTEIHGVVVQIPHRKLRPLLGIIIYWLSQHHAGKLSGVPGNAERHDIINHFLGN